MAGRAKESFPGGSLKYLFVYSKVRIFNFSYRNYIHIHGYTMIYIYIYTYLDELQQVHCDYDVTGMMLRIGGTIPLQKAEIKITIIYYHI